MNIALLLFMFETELADLLDGADLADDPTRQAVVDLLGRVHAVRMLPGLDDQPERPLESVTAASAASVESADDWDPQD